MPGKMSGLEKDRVRLHGALDYEEY